jgi:hypothetical protein
MNMKIIEVRIPEPVLRQAQDLAVQEDVTVDHLLSLAVTQMIAMWSTERQMSSDIKSHSRKQFLEMLQHALEDEQSNFKRVPLPG